MQHWQVPTSLVDDTKGSGGVKLGFVKSCERPLCPKPRRVAHSIPEFLVPLRCNKYNHPSSYGGSGFPNVMSDEAIGGSEPPCMGCLPPCYAGSPPGRTGNPLIHDACFMHQMELGCLPFTRANLPDNFGFRDPVSCLIDERTIPDTRFVGR